ncbi:dorsal-ventral patterning protein tolloid-like isoform X1 [Cotesia glomerata]|uniref:dorsal-ventral patterning protein tolloid-like isoform X1 n=1 Tax=Cotesia glomerata TaxID=32391 RepID=UPI001D02C10B|nr:dorsal-ventral patterning protein tolloid-like isoform X1 [Cotesia glomerata]
MLYSTNKFARDRSKNTITPLKTEDIEITKIGRYEQLSAIDINGANRLYNCSECRQLIESDSGVFNVVKDLNSSTSITKHCEWRMVGAPGERVIFHISSWSVPDTVGCRTNYLRVKDDFITPGWNIIEDVCGEGGLEEVASEASQLLITYHTNTLNSKYFGFTGNFRKVCRGDIDIVDEEKEYYLEFPGFPYQYTANKYCVWYPNASPNRKIILKFDYFQLEASENCKNDYIEIRKGNYYYSPLIGKYCINTSLEEIWYRRNTL